MSSQGGKGRKSSFGGVVKKSKEEKEAEVARERFFQAIGDSDYLLELLSGAGGIAEEHSLCRFCKHQGMPACPNGSTQKFGKCGDYTAYDKPADEVEEDLFAYLQDARAR